MVNFCWACFKWTIALVIVVGAAAVFALYPRLNEEIRSHFEAKIGGHYRNLKVQVRSAELVEGKGIVVHGFSISERAAEGPQAELLSVDEVVLECNTDWKKLIQEDLDIRRVTFRRPKLHATHRPDDTWSTAKLLPPPQYGLHPPEVIVESGSVEIFDPRKTPTSTLTLRDLNFSLVPATNPSTVARSGEKPPDIRRLKGMFAGDGFRRIEFEGAVDMRTSTCSIHGQAEAIDISPELRDSLPRPLISQLPMLDLRGQSNLRFEVRYDPNEAIPLKYNLAAKLVRGRIDDSRLPHSLTDIRAMIHIDNGGFTIDDFSARSGVGTISLSYRQSGFQPNSATRLTAEVRQLELDRSLANILPPSMQEQWYNFLPKGEIDADVQLSYDGQKWQPEITARCLNVSFSNRSFPYRLEQGKGTIELKDERLQVNVTAYAGSQPTRINADVSNLFSAPTGWLEVKGDDIQIDKTLLSALRAKPGEDVIHSLDPRGAVNVYMRLWRNSANEPMHKHLHLTLNHCSIRYDKFPYPLGDIRGTVEMLDNQWAFRNLSATNDKAAVTCEGTFMPGLKGNELVLNFVGRDVSLKDDLRDALSPHIQQVWRDLRPGGAVDLSAEIRYLTEDKKLSVGVRLKPQPQTASVDPIHFPYRLEKLQGTFIYRDGHVAFEQCKAEHGAVRILSEGSCDFQPDGRWAIHLATLTADRIRADRDRDLIQALPERLRKVVYEINPTGSINLWGSLDFERTGLPDEPLRSHWNLGLGMQQSNLQLGGLLVEGVHGKISLTGGFDGQQLVSRGEMDVDSLKYKEAQFTQVAGPFWIDNGRVLFGSWVDRPEGRAASVTPGMRTLTPRPLNANFCGGKFYADGWVLLGSEPRYGVNATLTGANLATFAQEFGVNHRNLRGKVTATADLTGIGYSRNRLAGRGNISLTEANVYELPQMVAMLKILSIRPPDQNAFSDAAINYRVEGEHIYFDRIDFHGDAISLRGKGDMDLQPQQIHLSFYTTVGRGELEVPIINQVFRGASQQIMSIRVTGSPQNPDIRREALPGVNRVLQELNGEPPNQR
jgi:hypothetical protein